MVLWMSANPAKCVILNPLFCLSICLLPSWTLICYYSWHWFIPIVCDYCCTSQTQGGDISISWSWAVFFLGNWVRMKNKIKLLLEGYAVHFGVQYYMYLFDWSRLQYLEGYHILVRIIPCDMVSLDIPEGTIRLPWNRYLRRSYLLLTHHFLTYYYQKRTSIA